MYHKAIPSSRALLSRHWRRQVLVLVCVVVVLYVVLPQLGEFRRSLPLLGGVSLAMLVVTSGLTLATFFVAALAYYVLALKPVIYGRALAVQGATGFTNRLLPAGLGGLGLNAAFLHAYRHSAAQAVAVVSVNNVLGFIGNMLLLGWALGTSASTSRVAAGPGLSTPDVMVALGVALGVLLLIGVVARMGTKRAIAAQLTALRQAFGAYARRSPRVFLGLACTLAITLLNVLIFQLCAHGIGIQLGYGQAVVAFTIGMAAATVTPTPGGLGGAEAGLTVGLVGYGAAADAALAAALLYRLLVYWLPLVPGFVLFNMVLRRRYVGYRPLVGAFSDWTRRGTIVGGV